MSDFKAKMYQIQFRLYSAPPDSLAGLRGLLLRGGERRDGKGEEREEGSGGDETPPFHAPPNPYFWIRP